MPDIDLGALTIPVFCTIFGAGWASCYTLMYLPLKTRVETLERKQAELFQEFQRRVLGQ
jgi:hypothetical protein